jgi:hypothetical protein
MSRKIVIAGIAGLFCLVGLAYADTHHNAQNLLGKNLGKNGKHVLHTNGDHTAHAHVQGSKVTSVEVVHKTKGAVKVTKVVTDKKHFAQAEPGVEHHYVSLNTDDTEPVGVGIAYVGWGYRVGALTVIYWFPVAVVANPATGAVVYVP